MKYGKNTRRNLMKEKCDIINLRINNIIMKGNYVTFLPYKMKDNQKGKKRYGHKKCKSRRQVSY